MRHTWLTNRQVQPDIYDGTWSKADDPSPWGMGLCSDDIHNGPRCAVCGFTFCMHCRRDGWDDDSCPGGDADV